MIEEFLYIKLLFYYFFIVFFFNDTATTEIYTLSLHDALPILWFQYQFVCIISFFYGGFRIFIINTYGI